VLFLVMSMAWTMLHGQDARRIIHLSWKNVVDISLKENLSLKSKSLDYELQNLETWKSLTSFLPSLSYQGVAQHSIELPVFVFMGQRFIVGNSLYLPAFVDAGIADSHRRRQVVELRHAEKHQEIAGRRTARERRRDRSERDAGLLRNYSFQRVGQNAEDAVTVAQQNLLQVQKFYNAGAATELDYQRANAQYSSTLPCSNLRRRVTSSPSSA